MFLVFERDDEMRPFPELSTTCLIGRLPVELLPAAEPDRDNERKETMPTVNDRGTFSNLLSLSLFHLILNLSLSHLILNFSLSLISFSLFSKLSFSLCLSFSILFHIPDLIYLTVSISFSLAFCHFLSFSF